MLTDEQIEKLFQFCEKKQVRFYDVQVELVDHLTNAIEKKMEINPQMPFEDALKDVYKEFGIFGFSHIVADKQAAVYTAQRKTFYQLVKKQFRWPAFLLFIITSYVFFNIFSFSGYLGIEISVLALLLVAFFLLFYTSWSILKIRKITQKKITLTHILYNSFWIYLPIYFFQFSHIFDYFEEAAPVEMTFMSNLLYSLGCSLYVVLLIAHYQTYQLLKKEVKLQFPELFLAK